MKGRGIFSLFKSAPSVPLLKKGGGGNVSKRACAPVVAILYFKYVRRVFKRGTSPPLNPLVGIIKRRV
jgi:hypothetical protein